MTRNVFVVGADAFNCAKLRSVPHAADVALHPLFTYEQVQGPARWPVRQLIRRGTQSLARFAGRRDGILGCWDLPVSALVSVLGERFGMPVAPLGAVVACEHKFWSRLIQREAIGQCVPSFCVVDPFSNGRLPTIALGYPYWIKPIKSFQSHLGFRVDAASDLEWAIKAIRAGIGRMAEPFGQLIAGVAAPPEVRRVTGYHCLAEQFVGGRQCTAEGYVVGGEVTVYGIIDSIRYPGVSSFARYEYPSLLPPTVQQRVRDAAARLIPALGLTHGAFNVEFFWDEPTDKLWVIEVNPRISQSHAALFEKVDGISHHQVALDLALGERPMWRTGQGPAGCAAKCFLRVFADGLITRVPDALEIERVTRQFPDTLVQVPVRAGQRLAALPDQDSYSYCLALVYLGAANREQLIERYQQIVEALPFEIDGQPVAPMQPAG